MSKKNGKNQESVEEMLGKLKEHEVPADQQYGNKARSLRRGWFVGLIRFVADLIRMGLTWKRKK